MRKRATIQKSTRRPQKRNATAERFIWKDGDVRVLKAGSAVEGDCIFCSIARFEDVQSGQIIVDLPSVYIMEPLEPVTDGHVLVIPRRHCSDAAANPELTSMVMKVAATYAKDIGDCNIITSVGKYASQSVFHLHVHVVPRRPDDGLSLPWGEIESAEELEKDAEEEPPRQPYGTRDSLGR